MNIDLNEGELIDRLKAGDEPAVPLMVDKYRNLVYYSNDHFSPPRPSL